jgi:hypothetical protein
MEDKWRIKKIGDNWMFIPKKERDEKSDYERLLNNISKREKKIESDLDKIKKLKEELNEMKKKRTVGFNKMIKYHNKFLPNFSIFMDDDLYGNQQWGMWVSIGGKRKYIYLGTVSKVSYHLDLLENNIPHYNENNSYQDKVGYYSTLNPKNYEDDKDKELIKSKIESYVCDVVQKNMLSIMNKDGNLDEFFDKKYKIKGTDILYELYKHTSHYTTPQVERERKKGGRLGPLSVGKKKNG